MVSIWEDQTHSGYFRHQKFNTEIGSSSRSTPSLSSPWENKKKVVLPGCTTWCVQGSRAPLLPPLPFRNFEVHSHQHTEPTHPINVRAESSGTLYPLYSPSVKSTHPYPLLVRKCSQEEKQKAHMLSLFSYLLLSTQN